MRDNFVRDEFFDTRFVVSGLGHSCFGLLVLTRIQAREPRALRMTSDRSQGPRRLQDVAASWGVACEARFTRYNHGIEDRRPKTEDVKLRVAA